MCTKRFSLIFSIIVCAVLASCSSPTSVAEKALKTIGLGTFASSDLDRLLGTEPLAVIMLTTDYGDIFDDALQKSSEAEFAREKGYHRKTKTSSYFDFSNVLFDRFELISKEELTRDLYGITDYKSMRDSDLDKEVIESMIKIDKGRKDYELSGDGYYGTWLEAENVPWILMRYKLDNKYIASLSVLKLPNKGYRVCSFSVE